MHRPFSRLPLLLWASLVLVSCGTPSGPPPEEGPPTGGQNVWRDRLDPAVADPYAEGRSYPWSSAQPGDNLLSALQWTSATSGEGPVERDRSVGGPAAGDGGALTIAGQTYAHGLGVQADSELRYALHGRCSRLEVTVGLDDEAGDGGLARFEVWGDDRLLADSGEVGGADAPRALEADLAGAAQMRLVVRAVGGDPQAAHADWAGPVLRCAAAEPAADVSLSDLAYVRASNGWGPIERDAANGEQAQGDGPPLRPGAGGGPGARGLGVHAPSSVVYALAGHCSTLRAQVGVDAGTGGRGSVVFRVLGDGRVLYDSGVLRGTDAAVDLGVDVRGVREVHLEVGDAGDGIAFDHADWGDVRLTCGPAGAPGSPDAAYAAPAPGGVDAVLEPDGALVVLDAQFGLRRLSPLGTELARSAPLGGPAAALARWPDGSLVAVGGDRVARFRPDLTPDPAYGTGGVVRLPADWRAALRDVAALSGDRVALTGGATVTYAPNPSQPTLTDDNQDLVVARLAADGAPDPAFGQGGRVLFDGWALGNAAPSRPDDVGLALVAAPGDHLWVAGESVCCSGHRGVLLRLGPTGQPAPAFGEAGGVLGAGPYDAYEAVLPEPGGGVLVSGWNDRFATRGTVRRYGAAGQLLASATFQYAPEWGRQNRGTALALGADGAVYVGGRSDTQAFVARFRADLTPDVSFGEGGWARLNGETTSALAVDGAGRVLAITPAQTARLWP